jgi:hypothetical protein
MSDILQSAREISRRKAEARRQVDRLVAFCRPGSELAASMAIVDAYACACIDEAVAHALGVIDNRLREVGGNLNGGLMAERERLWRLRKLLTERAGT